MAFIFSPAALAIAMSLDVFGARDLKFVQVLEGFSCREFCIDCCGVQVLIFSLGLGV